MLADAKNSEIFCDEVMQDTIPSAWDGPVAMEDIKHCEHQDEPNKQTRFNSPFLTLVTKLGPQLAISNSDYCGENFVESLAIANSLPEYKTVAPLFPRAQLGRKTRSSPEATLVLDLDETLVYSSCDAGTGCDHMLTLEDKAIVYKIFVNVRPYVDVLLKSLSKFFEIVIFTASEKEYADKVINLLDPQKKLVKYRLYRESCLRVDNTFVKDLNTLGRDISKTIIVDNALHSFAYQTANGILIKSYLGDKTDTALLALRDLLLDIKDSEDLRIGLKEHAGQVF